MLICIAQFHLRRYRAIEEMLSGAQAPIEGVTVGTHPHLFQRPFKLDAHEGQYWLGAGGSGQVAHAHADV